MLRAKQWRFAHLKRGLLWLLGALTPMRAGISKHQATRPPQPKHIFSKLKKPAAGRGLAALGGGVIVLMLG